MKILIFSILMCVCLIDFGCRPSGYNVKFIIPDDYRGPISIEESKDGVRIKKENSFWVFEIPDNGILKVQSDRPLQRITVPAKAMYRSGGSVSWALPVFLEKNLDRNEIMLYQLGASANGRFYFFVGNYRDAHTYWSEGRL